MKKLLYIFASLAFGLILFTIVNSGNHAQAKCGDDDQADFFNAGAIDCGDEIWFYDPELSIRLDKPVFRDDKNGQYMECEPSGTNCIERRISGGVGDTDIGTDNLQNVRRDRERTDDDGQPYCSLFNPTNCQPFDKDCSAVNTTYKNDLTAGGNSVNFNEYEGPKRGDCNEFFTTPVPASLQAKIDALIAGLREARAAEAANDACEDAVNNPLSFVICPVLKIVTGFVDSLTGFLEDRLDIRPLTTDAGNPLRQGFNRFRNVANSLYIIIFLIIIISNFISVGLDNYSIKKMLPRLLVAVIGTQFAFLICALAIDISNILTAAAPSIVGNITGGATTFGAGLSDQFVQIVLNDGLLAGAGAVVFIIIVCIALAIVVLLALAYIIFRDVFLIVLVFVSPLALAAWVLPQTQTFAKKWANWFVKLLVMGPIIALILAITLVTQSIFTQIAASSTPPDLFLSFVAILVPFIGFLLVPKSLKWSGDVMGAAGRIGKGQDYIKEKGKKSAKEGKLSQARGVAGESFGRGLSNRTGGRLGSKMEARGKARREAPNEELKKSIESLDFERQLELSKKGGKAGKIAGRVVGAKQSELLNKRVLSSGDVQKLAQLKHAGVLRDPEGHIDKQFLASMGYGEEGEELKLSPEQKQVIPNSVQNPFWKGDGSGSSESPSGSTAPLAPPAPPPGGRTSSSRSSSGSRGPTPSPSPSSPAPSSSSPSSRWRAATPRPNPAGTSGPRVIPGTGGAVDLGDLTGGGSSAPPEPPPGTTE